MNTIVILAFLVAALIMFVAWFRLMARLRRDDTQAAKDITAGYVDGERQARNRRYTPKGR